jgi:hypothetical protein
MSDEESNGGVIKWVVIVAIVIVINIVLYFTTGFVIIPR